MHWNRLNLDIFTKAAVLIAVFSNSLQAGETGGSPWTVLDTVVHQKLYIEKVRSKLPGRIERIKVQTGKEIALDYQYDLEVEPHRTDFRNAANFQQSPESSHGYFSKVIKDTHRLVKKVQEAEKDAFRSWEEEPRARGSWNLIPEETMKEMSDGAGLYRKGEIYGTMIEASNLGVILDVSPSMSEYLPALKATIQDKFPDVVFIGTSGSFVKPVDENCWWWAEPSHITNPFQPDFFHDPDAQIEPHFAVYNATRDGGAAVLAMVELAGFDVVYWYTDFDDPIEKVNDFSDRIEKAGARFYIHPQGNSGPTRIGRAAKRTGGDVIKGKIDTSVSIPRDLSQNVILEFDLIETDGESADLLEKKLGDGEVTSKFMERLPDLVAGKNIRSLSSTESRSVFGEMGSGVEGIHTFKSGSGEYFLDGMYTEANSQMKESGLIEVDFETKFARKKGSHVQVFSTKASLETPSNQYFLANRFTDETGLHQVLIGRVTQSYADKTAGDSSKETSSGMGRIDVAVYRSKSDFDKNEFPVFKTSIAADRGIPSFAEISTPVRYVKSNEQQVGTVGWRVDWKPLIDAVTKKFSAQLDITYTAVDSREERMENDEFVTKFEIHKTSVQTEFTSTAPQFFPMGKTSFATVETQPSEWIVMVKVPTLTANTYSSEAGLIPEKQLLSKFADERSKAVDKPFERAVGAVNRKYLTALNSSIKKSRDASDSKTTTALQKEIVLAQSQSGILSGQSPSNTAELNRLRKIYDSLVDIEIRKRDSALVVLKKKYPGLPKDAELAKEENSEKSEMAKTGAVTPGNSISKPDESSSHPAKSQSSGKLVFAGQFEGQPRPLPDELKDQTIEWIRIINPENILVATKRNGIFSFDDKLEFRKVRNGYLNDVGLGYGWHRTVLTAKGKLVWHHISKTTGTLENIKKFQYSGGAKMEILIALSNENTLHLIEPHGAMKWNFEAWAEPRRFADIALPRNHALRTAILLLDDSGTLHAFNRDGIYELPSELRDDVASISSGIMGINLVVVKKNGQVYELRAPIPGANLEIAREDYLDIKKWKILSSEDLKSRPIRVHCGDAGRSIQLEDGSWMILKGQQAIGSPVPFPDGVNADSKYRDLLVAFPSSDSFLILGIE